jgi:hypothetical protein
MRLASLIASNEIELPTRSGVFLDEQPYFKHKMLKGLSHP